MSVAASKLGEAIDELVDRRRAMPSLDPTAHRAKCAWRRALTCTTPIACGFHGKDVCIECDPCVCDRPKRRNVRTELSRDGQLELERLGRNLDELGR